MLHNSDNIKFINKVISFSGIALLVMFFMPSVKVSLLWSDTEILSLCQLAAEEYFGINTFEPCLLFLLAFEMAISGAELPRLSFCCAILHLILSIYILVDMNIYLKDWGSVYPSFWGVLFLVLPCVVIFIMIREIIKNRPNQTK